jgi:hypothetical protein
MVTIRSLANRLTGRKIVRLPVTDPRQFDILLSGSG